MSLDEPSGSFVVWHNFWKKARAYLNHYMLYQNSKHDIKQ